MQLKYAMQSKVNPVDPWREWGVWGAPRLSFCSCGISCDRGQTAGRSAGKIQRKSRNEEDKEQEENRFSVPGGVWHKGEDAQMCQPVPPGPAQVEEAVEHTVLVSSWSFRNVCKGLGGGRRVWLTAEPCHSENTLLLQRWIVHGRLGPVRTGKTGREQMKFIAYFWPNSPKWEFKRK